MASIGSEHASRSQRSSWRISSRMTSRFGWGRAVAWLRVLFADGSDSSLARRLAGAAFLIRVVSALIAFLSQIVLARWLGGFQFGIYVYVWTWVLLIGGMVDLGLGSASQRFIPEYTEHRRFALLRGYLGGSRWLASIIATIVAAVAAVGVTALSPLIGSTTVVPLYLACAALPIYGLVRGAERNRALLRLGQSRAQPRLRAAADRAAGADGLRLCVRPADECGDRDAHRRRGLVDRHHRPARRAQSAACDRRRAPVRRPMRCARGSRPRRRSLWSRLSISCSPIPT